MITKFKIFENNSEDFKEYEYIFKCSINFMCEEDCEVIEGLDNFTEEDYQDYKNEGEIWNEYFSYAFEKFGISWESDTKYNKIEIRTSRTSENEYIDDEGYSEDEYENIRNIVSDALNLQFSIYENVNHPKVKQRKQVKKFKI